MDFNKLMQTMRDLDRPVGEAAVQECGDSMMGGMAPPMSPPMNGQPPPSHPSMSVNLNAQGMDNIESLLKLMTKVNPDMINQPAPMAPSLTPPPLTAIPTISSIGNLGNLDKGPLKMLPDLDADNNDMPGGEMDMDLDMDIDSDSDYNDDGELDRHEKDHASERGLLKSLDLDNDGDHDMQDHEAEKEGPGPDGSAEHEGPEGEEPEDEESEEDDEEKKEAFGNSVANHDGESYKGMSAAMPNGTDMHKQKGTYPKVAGGDNPMQRVKEGTDLRAQIRAELLQRLAEAKGAK